MDLELCDKRIIDALHRLSKTPDIVSYNSLAWAYRDLLHYYFFNFSEEGISDTMDCIEALGYRDPAFQESVLYLILAVLKRYRGCFHSHVVDKFFDYIFFLKIGPGHPVYFKIMSAFIFNSRLWGGFGCFCEWWDFSNFSDRHFVRPDGEYAIGCHAYEAYSRFLLKSGFSLLQIPFFSDFVRRMSFSSFSPYANFHIAGFLTHLGCDTVAILRVLRPYIKLKYRKPWSWIVVADVFDVDDVRHRACLFFALECSVAFPDYLNLLLWYRLARYFQHTGELDCARYFINRICGVSPGMRRDVQGGFYTILRPSADTKIPDTGWNYREICHGIFAGVRDVDDDLWRWLYGWISGFPLS